MALHLTSIDTGPDALRADVSLDAAVSRHPVLRLLPPEAKALVRSAGVWRTLAPGAMVDGRAAIGFVLDGCVAAMDSKSVACVGLHGPGAMFGLEATLNAAFFPVRLYAMTPARWIEAPAGALAELMGMDWIEHIFARHALSRLRALEAEAACNAAHQLPRRTANLIHRLYRAEGPQLQTTQAILARALGAQRTSVNAAIKSLERDGALRTARARLVVTDAARLGRYACGC